MLFRSGGCCFALFIVVYFFMIESQGRSLEEIDTMYMLHVNPITSSKWDSSSLSKDEITKEMPGFVSAMVKIKTAPFEVLAAPLSDVHAVWQSEDSEKKRLVLLP